MVKSGRLAHNITSLDRGLKILDILSCENGGLGVTEISRRLQSDKSIVYRTLSVLMNRNYVEQDMDSKKYLLAWKIIQLAGQRIRNMDFYSAAGPILKQVVRETNEMAILAVMIGDVIAYLHKEEGSHTLNISSSLGQPISIHSTASGKAILAYLPYEERCRILRDKGLPIFTAKTITSLQKLEKHLEEVRARGYASDDEETYPGIRCVAAPIRNHNGAVVASLSISGPTQRITNKKLGFFAETALKAAAAVSARLGYEEPWESEHKQAISLPARVATTAARREAPPLSPGP